MSSRFKKGFSAVLAVVSVVSSGQMAPCIAAAADAVTAAVTKITGGDVNGDGKTDQNDVDALYAFLGKTVGAAEKNSKYDFYKDGSVDVRDLLAVKQLADKKAPVMPEKEASGDTVRIEVGSAECVPGEKVSIDVNIIDWDQDLGAAEFSLDFDPSLKLDSVSCTGSYQYVSDSNEVKLFGVTELIDVYRGTVATLTFDVPDTAYGDYDVKIRNCAVYNNSLQSLKPTTKAGLIAADVTERPLYLSPSYVNSKSMRLTWSMPYCSGDLEGYIVYRDGKEIARVRDPEFYDEKLETGKKYVYEVQAYGADGYLSAKSKSVTASPKAPVISALSFPDNASVIGGRKADLRVTMENTVDAASYSLSCVNSKGEEQTIYTGENTAISAADIRWNIQDVPSGEYTLTFRVTDKDGASAEKSMKVNVDTAPPEQVFGFDVFEGEKETKLTWGIAAEAKVVGYNIYRRTENGTYKLLKYIDKRDTLEYTDKDINEGDVFFYMMCAVDKYGQEGIYSDEKSAAAKGDETAPDMTLFLPESGKVLSHYVTISLKAEDNIGVSSVAAFISEDDGKTWTKLFEGKGASASYSFDTSAYEEAKIKMKALAYDYAGNESKELVHIYAVDNKGPEQVVKVRSASVSDVVATIAWNDVADDDFSHFNVKYYPTEDPEKATINSVYRSLGTNIYGLTPDTSYTVEIAAVDIYDNIGAYSEPITFETTSDETAPVISSFGPAPGFYSTAIPVTFSARDDYNVESVSIQASQSNEKDAKFTDVTVIKNTEGGAGFSSSYSLDLSAYKEGKIYLRAFAKDTAGNVGEFSAIHEYVIDRTAPAAPTAFSASAEADTIELKWEPYENNADSEFFSLYRSDMADGEYTPILEKSDSINYFDRSAEPGKTYYYKLTAIDTAGNESPMSKAVSAVLKEDKEKPEIVSIAPEENSILSTVYNQVSVLASDNVKLAAITLEYRLTEDGAFKQFAEVKDINDYYKVAEAALPAEALKDGTVEVRATAVDKAGLKSEAKTAKYTVDNSATMFKEIKAEQLTDHISLTWTAEENKLSTGYYVYKKANTGSWQRIGSIAAEAEKKGSYEFTDYSKNAAGTLVYRVEAYCSNGIMTAKETDPMQIYTAPDASLVVENTQQKNVEYIFDASGSRDYYGIESIVIDYGDGTTARDSSAATARFIHKYTKTGTYTVTLTVTNEQGLVSTVTRNIEVIERVLIGESTVYVKTTDGKNASNISVYVDLGTDRQKKVTTDSTGKATFSTVAGIHTIGVFGDGYLPAEKECTIVAGNSNRFDFTVTEKDIVTADFKVQRMKLDEIKAAGIDITAPENQHILEVEVNLTYKAHEHDKGRMTFLTNGKGGIISGGAWSGWVGGGSWGGDTADTVTKPVYVSINPETNEVDTLITMTVPIKARFLKEFFRASLTVYNNADEQYTISQNHIALNLPEGLTLVETETSDPQEVDLGVIEGHSSKDVNWIIRGDVDGKYNISASYTGHLDRFNEDLSAEFTPDEPITVYGEKAVKVDVIVPEQMFDNRFVFEVRMTNNSPVDVYCPAVDVGKIISSAFGTSDYGFAFVRQRSIKKDGKYVRIIPTDDPPLEILEPGYTYSVVYHTSDIFNWDALDENDATGADSFYDSRLDLVSASLEVMNGSRIPVSLTVVPNQEFIIVDEIKQLDYDSSKEFVVFVTGGRYEKPLKNATVNFDGESRVTNDDGYVVLPLPKDDKNHIMDVHCGGFKRREMLPYIGYTNGIDYVQLEATDMYEDEDNEDDQHYEPGHVSTGYVDAGGNLATPGAFGNPEDETKTIIQRYPGNLNLGKSFEYEINEDVPIVGGHKFNFENLNLPMEFSLDDKGFASIILLNKGVDLKTFFDDDPDNDGDEPEDEDSLQTEFKNACKIINQFKGKTMRQIKGDLKNAAIKKQPVKLGGEMDLLDPDNVKFDLSFLGALSASYDPKKGFAECVRSGGVVFRGQILIQFEFKYGFETNVVVGAIPLVIGAGIGAKANLDSAFSIECNDGNIDFTGTVALDFEIGGEVFFGVGVAETIGAGVYGEISPHIYFTLISAVPEDIGINKLTLEYEVGFRIYLGPFELKKDVSYLSTDDPIILYSKKREQQSLPYREFNLNHYLAAIMNESLYAIDEIKQSGQWSGGEQTIKSADGYLPLSVLASDTIDTTSVQLASAGGHLVMAYLDSDTTRDAVNAYRLMYSVYDEKTGWSKPVQLDSDKTGDYAPYLWSDGSQLYVIYQNAAEGLTGKSELTDWTAAQNIAAAKFDAKTLKFGAPQAITTDTGTYDKNPVIATAGGKTYAAWNSNSDTSYFGMNTTNSIMLSVLGEDGWSEPEAVLTGSNTITDMLIADHNDEPYIVFITDDNNDLATSDDRSLLTLKYGETEPYLISSGSVSAITYTKAGADKENCLYWQQDSNIKRSEDLTGSDFIFFESQPGLNTGFNIAGNRIIWTESESKTTSNLWSASFDSKTGEWGNISKLTSQDQFIENPSSAVLNGKTVTVMDRRDLNFTEEGVSATSSIVSLSIEDITNIALTDVYADNDIFSENGTLPVSLTVENRGSGTVSGVHVTAKGDDGTVLLDKVFDTEIAANDVGFIDTVLKPDPSKTKSIKFTVNTADDKDTFADDSTFDITTQFSYITATAKKTEGNTLEITATNNGTAAGSDEVTIAELGSGKVIDTISFKDIAAGKSVTQNVDLSKYSGIATGGVTIKGNDMAAEQVIYNAMENVSAEEYTLGDINNDGYIDSSDATDVLKEYAALSTGSKSTLTDIQKKAADIDGDGHIDAKDATAILVYYAALSTGGNPSFK